MEHLTCRCTVDVSAIPEYFSAPALSGEMGQDPRLDCAEIRYDELFSVFRYERGPDQFGQHSGHRRVEKVQCFIVSDLHQFPGLVQILHVVLRQVLQLDEPACPSAAPVGAVELKHAPAATILTDSILHGLVFLHAAFGGLQP